jgi:hypothetical protein
MDSVEFLNHHNDLCDVCNIGGELLCCSTCNLVFHLDCVRPILTELPPGKPIICVLESQHRGKTCFRKTIGPDTPLTTCCTFPPVFPRLHSTLFGLQKKVTGVALIVLFPEFEVIENIPARGKVRQRQSDTWDVFGTRNECNRSVWEWCGMRI